MAAGSGDSQSTGLIHESDGRLTLDGAHSLATIDLR